MAMTTAEMDTRATKRAISERLHTFKVTGQPVYLVRSRQTEPGSMHEVRTDTRTGQVQSCTCTGWLYRRSCTHAAAVTRRLERGQRKAGRS
jgi:hypothetical protein